jgi:glutamate synthase (NADPH/NADH) small chain
VVQFEIMPELPDERAEDNPWPLWPRLRKTDYGQVEAIEMFGADPREYCTTVKEIVGDGGKVTGVKTVRVEWRPEDVRNDGVRGVSGGAGTRMTPVEISGSERERPCDIVLTAMGFTGPERLLIDQLSLDTDVRGFVKCRRPGSYHTNTPTVFAAGDIRRGPSLVVWAIDEGRRAARACHEYLVGR